MNYRLSSHTEFLKMPKFSKITRTRFIETHITDKRLPHQEVKQHIHKHGAYRRKEFSDPNQYVERSH